MGYPVVDAEHFPVETFTPERADEVFARAEVLVVLDMQNRERLGRVAPYADTPGLTIAILDHHVGEAAFGQVNVVRPEKAATGELIYDLIRREPGKLTRPMAEALYTALVTDTGSFRHSNTDPDVHTMAADLLSPSEGTVGESLPMESILPVLAALRPRLRAYLPADLAQLSRRDLPKDQHRALLLLAWFSDPADDALIDPWGVAQKLASRPSRRCSGATLHAALQAWESLHFEKEGYKQGAPRPYASVNITQAPGGEHAVALLSVRYAHWGYSQRVILVRWQGVWEVRRVPAYEQWQGRE
jgi:hypothetical protein